MIHVLHVIGYLGRGGDTSVVLDVQSHADPDQYHFDFVTHEGTTRMEVVQMLRDAGCTVHILKGDVRKLGPIGYYRAFSQLLQTCGRQYDAIHVHTGMQSGIALLAAKRAGIPRRICHSHVTTIQRQTSRLKKLVSVPVFRYLYNANSTQKAACSRMAGDFLFGSGYELLYNAVDLDRFLAVTPEDAAAARAALGIGAEDVVIGQVARMSQMKNQRFLISLARELPERKFVLVGGGKDLEELQALAADCPNVIFTGQRSDVPTLMKCFDVCVLPSLPGEGFPVTMLEAQAAGCRCIISDKVTGEVEVGLNLVSQLPLEDREGWLRALRTAERITDPGRRDACARQLAEMGFGKAHFAEKWLDLYG